MIIDEQRDFFDSAACGQRYDASHKTHESGYGRETEKETLEIYVGIALRALDTRLCADAAVAHCRRYSRPRFYHHVSTGTGPGTAKFTLGEEALCRFQEAFS